MIEDALPDHRMGTGRLDVVASVEIAVGADGRDHVAGAADIDADLIASSLSRPASWYGPVSRAGQPDVRDMVAASRHQDVVPKPPSREYRVPASAVAADGHVVRADVQSPGVTGAALEGIGAASPHMYEGQRCSGRDARRRGRGQR